MAQVHTGKDSKQSQALSPQVLQELVTHADAGSREHELRGICSYLNEENYGEEEAYKLICALGELNPEQYPFERCKKLLDGGVSVEMLVPTMQAADSLSKDSGLTEELLPIALRVFQDAIAEGGKVEKADIVFRLEEALGKGVDEKTTEDFLMVAQRMIGNGNLCYAESWADFNRTILDDRGDRSDDDDEV